jgi:hypothetical protein
VTPPLRLGAPGIYRQPLAERPRQILPRMEVCAFVGVAPRGPAREPKLEESWRFDRPCVEPNRARRRSVAVAVESFQEFQRLFGGFDGPGRLPLAVASFFEQGGQRAYVVRIVHEYGEGNPNNAAGVACGRLSGAVPSAGTLWLLARSEGRWGNALRAEIGFTVTPIGFDRTRSDSTRLFVGDDDSLPVGALLRVTAGGLRVLRFVHEVHKQELLDQKGARIEAVFDSALTASPELVEVVEGELFVDDGRGQQERHQRLGLSRRHWRWMGTILCYESALIYPDPSWVEGEVTPEDVNRLPLVARFPVAGRAESPQFTGGEDRYDELNHADFFDSAWVLGNPEPGDGLCALTHLDDLSSVVVPDLYSPEPLMEVEDVRNQPPGAGPTFERCLDAEPTGLPQETSPSILPGLLLDPKVLRDLDRIIELQGQVVEFADRLNKFVVLLDVPMGLTHRQVLHWRSQFRSSYAAAYHPWLLIGRKDDRREGLIRLNPSAVAAGIIARQEIAFGLTHGPANALAAGVVALEEAVSPARHDEIHPLGINVYLAERDGVRLTAGRTLARDPRYRQLTVRRLMLSLRRALSQQTHWMVFESNGPSLWADVRHMFRNYLSALYQSGAFTGVTEEEAFFVRCDGQLNTQRVVDSGKLVVEVGVAPSEPIEFIVLRITADADGTVLLEE